MPPGISATQAIWVQLGVAGFFILFLIGMVYRYEKRFEKVHFNHSVEREAWREQAATQHTEIIEVAKNSNTILAEIATIIQERL